jgi:hypothetical protein
MSQRTGFELEDDRDLIEVFQTRTNTVVTNFISSTGIDLGNIFMTGNSGIVTNYQALSNGIYKDLGSIFDTIMPFVVPVTNTIIYGATTNTTGTRYCYAIFANNNSVVNNTVTINQDNTNITAVLVGGGGGGGNAGTNSPGGGGGGGVFLATDNPRYIGYTYNVTIGSGGYYNGTSYVNGTATTIVGNGTTFIQCNGGTTGGGDSAGFGGISYVYGVQQDSVINGGNGGDQSNGLNSYYNNSDPTYRKLAIPSILVQTLPSYISYYYSGGGAGGKGSNEDSSALGGGGGGYGGTIPNPPTGIGGIRYGSTIYDGQPGLSYGGGGGAGGYDKGNNYYGLGAPGCQGICIVYAPIIIPVPDLPFTAYGAFIYGATTNTTGTRYCYAIYTDTNINNVKTVTYTKSQVQIYAIVVGGGGGGGGTSLGYSPGGGGGGGVYSNYFNGLSSIGEPIYITVGQGGNGGPVGGSGTAGGTSQVTRAYSNEYFTCTGGGGGTIDGSGNEGGWSSINSPTITPNGGYGGDRQFASSPSQYHSGGSSLGIPAELLAEHPTYISNYYSGGGGGSKGNGDDVSYAGGYGGNTLVDNIPSGLGGARGLEGYSSTNYWNGHPGDSWGGGGGSGGWNNVSYQYPGGPGKQGIVIIYSPI